MCCIMKNTHISEVAEFDYNKCLVLYTSSIFSIQIIQVYFRKHYGFVTNTPAKIFATVFKRLLSTVAMLSVPHLQCGISDLSRTLISDREYFISKKATFKKPN